MRQRLRDWSCQGGQKEITCVTCVCLCIDLRLAVSHATDVLRCSGLELTSGERRTGDNCVPQDLGQSFPRGRNKNRFLHTLSDAEEKKSTRAFCSFGAGHCRPAFGRCPSQSDRDKSATEEEDARKRFFFLRAGVLFFFFRRNT